LLPEEERAALRRLSVFAGEFPLEAAIAVAADPGSPNIVDHVANLVGKSLVAADPRGDAAQYRLLDTTRLYTFEKLQSSGEFKEIARRHAEYYCAVFAPAEAESESRPQAEWLAIYGRHLANVRAGLDWAFSPDGDPQIGAALTVAVVPLWVQLSLLGESRQRVEQALAVLEADDPTTTRRRMQLSAALGWSLMYGVGRGRETGPAWATTLAPSSRSWRSSRSSACGSICGCRRTISRLASCGCKDLSSGRCGSSGATSRKGTLSGRPCPSAASWARGHARSPLGGRSRYCR